MKFHAWYCEEFVENLQVPRRSPHERGQVPVVVAVAAVTDRVAVVAATADTAAVDATIIVLPVGDRWWRGVTFRTPAAPGPGSATGASRVPGGTGFHTSVMSRSDSLFKYSNLPPP